MSLIDNLINSDYLVTPRVIEAFRKIKRQDFVRPGDESLAEIDAPLGIGHGQTISQPATVAFMLEKLRPEPGEKILDIGCGSGWTTALLAKLVGERGRVYGVERIPELKDFAVSNINKYIRSGGCSAEVAGQSGRSFIENGVAHIICSDGYHGLPEFAPFDKILVSAAAEEVPPELLRELKIGGRLILPLGEQYQSQSIVVIEKFAERKFKTKSYPGFVFVPLVKSD
jgi:protein-L-isoaspartate(D-aspartate) O-methyltransferase